MKITKLHISPIEGKEHLLANVSVTVDNAIALHNILIRKRHDSEEIVVDMARTKSVAKDRFYDVFHPINAEARAEFVGKIMECYNAYLSDPSVDTFEAPADGCALNITDVSVPKVFTDGNVRGYATVTLDDGFVLRQIRIVKKKDSDELILGMPSRKLNNGNYFSICHPISNDVRKVMTDAVLVEYDKALAAETGE